MIRKEVYMLGVIKQKSKSLLTFSKYILISMLSALIWFLYFVGATADVAEHYLKYLKNEISKGKKDVRVNDMEDK